MAKRKSKLQRMIRDFKKDVAGRQTSTQKLQCEQLDQRADISGAYNTTARSSPGASFYSVTTEDHAPKQVLLDEDDNERIIDDSLFNRYGTSSRKRPRNRYQGSSSSSEDDGEDTNPNHEYKFSTPTENFHFGLLIPALRPASDTPLVDFREPPTVPKEIEPSINTPTIDENFFQLMNLKSVEDEIEALNERISYLNTTLNGDPYAFTDLNNGKFLIRLVSWPAPSFKTSNTFFIGIRRSKWLELIDTKGRLFEYKNIKEWATNQQQKKETEMKESEEHYETLLRAMEKMTDREKKTMILPAFITYSARARVLDYKTKEFNPKVLFDLVEGNQWASLNIPCWRQLFFAFLSDFKTFNVDAVASAYDRVVKHVFTSYIGTVSKMDVKRESVYRIIEEMVDSRCRLDVETGNQARVVTLLQLLTEFHYCAPQESSKSDFDSKLNRFKKFINSGCQRFGEEGSGWDAFVHNNETGGQRNNRAEELSVLKGMGEQQKSYEDSLLCGYLDTYRQSGKAVHQHELLGKLWRDFEKHRADKYWRPLKFKHPEIEKTPCQFIEPSTFYDTLKFVQNREQAPLLILKLLQSLGVYFGHMPVKLGDVVLENSHFSTLITSLLKDSFPEFTRDNLELDQFLISFMHSLCTAQQKQKDGPNIGFALINGMVETIGQRADPYTKEELLKMCERLYKSGGEEPGHSSKKLHLSERDFFKIQMLNLEADNVKLETRHGYPSNWMDINPGGTDPRFEKSSIFKKLLKFARSLGPLNTIEGNQDRAIVFHTILSILKRLGSSRNLKQPFHSRARFLVLWLGVAGDGLELFDTRRFKIQDQDLKNALVSLSTMFNSEPFPATFPKDVSTVIGTSKDLLLMIYAIMFYEVHGRSLFEFFYTQRSRDPMNEDEKKNIKQELYFNNSFFFPFYRAEFSEPMVRRNLIPSSMYNEWAFDLIQQNPYHATVWRSSLPAIEYNHSLIERLPARRCCEPGSAKRSLLHWLLVFCTQWDPNNSSEEQQLRRLQKTLERAVEAAEGLSFPDSTAARLSLSVEMSLRTRLGTREGKINELYRDLVFRFPYAKVLTFDILPDIVDGNQLNGIGGMLKTKGLKRFVEKEELENMLEEKGCYQFVEQEMLDEIDEAPAEVSDNADEMIDETERF